MDGKAILLVDVDDNFKELMQMVLELNEYQMVCARDGLVARRHLEVGLQ